MACLQCSIMSELNVGIDFCITQLLRAIIYQAKDKANDFWQKSVAVCKENFQPTFIHRKWLPQTLFAAAIPYMNIPVFPFS